MGLFQNSGPRKVTAMILEPGRLTDYQLGMSDKMKLEITHNGKTLKFDKAKVLQKIFTERNWRGNPKRFYVFCELNEGKPALVGLDEFNPYRAFSSEEADIMIHESVTLRGARNLVTKVKGVGGPRKMWIFLIMLVVIISVVYMKMQGMI